MKTHIGWDMDRLNKIHDAIHGTVNAFDERYDLNDRQVELLHTIMKLCFEFGKEIKLMEIKSLRNLNDD